eukprot:14587949-Alexandrium_andersonii.AAC.1
MSVTRPTGLAGAQTEARLRERIATPGILTRRGAQSAICNPPKAAGAATRLDPQSALPQARNCF